MANGCDVGSILCGDGIPPCRYMPTILVSFLFPQPVGWPPFQNKSALRRQLLRTLLRWADARNDVKSRAVCYRRAGNTHPNGCPQRQSGRTWWRVAIGRETYRTAYSNSSTGTRISETKYWGGLVILFQTSRSGWLNGMLWWPVNCLAACPSQ